MCTGWFVSPGSTAPEMLDGNPWMTALTPVVVPCACGSIVRAPPRDGAFGYQIGLKLPCALNFNT